MTSSHPQHSNFLHKWRKETSSKWIINKAPTRKRHMNVLKMYIIIAYDSIKSQKADLSCLVSLRWQKFMDERRRFFKYSSTVLKDYFRKIYQDHNLRYSFTYIIFIRVLINMYREYYVTTSLMYRTHDSKF